MAQPKRARLFVCGNPSSNTGQSSCDDADAGYYVSSTAQTSQTACVAKPSAVRPARARVVYQRSSRILRVLCWSDECDCMQSGYYQTSSGQSCVLLMQATMFLAQRQSSQTACAAGTFSSVTGLNSSPMRCKATMYQFRVNRAQQSA